MRKLDKPTKNGLHTFVKKKSFCLARMSTNVDEFFSPIVTFWDFLLNSFPKLVLVLKWPQIAATSMIAWQTLRWGKITCESRTNICAFWNQSSNNEIICEKKLQKFQVWRTRILTCKLCYWCDVTKVTLIVIID